MTDDRCVQIPNGPAFIPDCLKVSLQSAAALAFCHVRGLVSVRSSDQRGEMTVKMKTLALVTAGSLALLGGSNAFAQCNFNAWLPANGNTGGGAFSNGSSVTAPTATITPGSPSSTPADDVRRYSGRCGLRATGPTNYVQDGSPSETATFRARFYVRATGVTGGNATVYRALNNNATPQQVIGVAFNPSTNRFIVSTGTGGGTAEFGPVTGSSWYSIELNWATTPSNSLTVTVRGAGTATDVPVAAGTNPITNFGTITGGANIETVQLGFVAGPATAGVVTADAYESRRQNAIGRLCRGDANNDGGVSGPDIVQTRTESLGGALALGQPDCNEDGGVSGPDIICIRNLSLTTGCSNP